MFPIIPAHMLNGTPSASLGKMASANANYSNAFWDIWTEDFIRRKYISTASSDSIHQSNDPLTEIKVRENKCAVAKMEANLNTGSYALETISRDTKTRPFDCIDLSSGHVPKLKSFISTDASGFIVNDQHFSESMWLRSLNLAHDTYSHNAQLEITNDHRLRVKIVKNLVIDEEIQLWFSDEILAILTIPFLTPANILGKNCYKCNECDKTYESPNPLKIHLALKCDRYTIDDLWMRLNNILPLTSYSVSHPISLSRRHLLTTQAIENESKRTSLESNERLRQSVLPFVPSLNPNFLSTTGHSSSSSSNSNNSFPSSPYPHPFSIQKLQQTAFPPHPMSLSPPQLHQFGVHSTHTFQSHPQPSHSVSTSSTNTISPGEKVVAAAAAQLETIVSNMGTSKQGHVCIYCGKLYSRKYGLKIHIRTHTGFKPLKCKYCLRPFGDPSNLNKHIRLHVQEKSLHKCHVCNKILVRRRDLLRHMNIKHNMNEHISDAQYSGECDISNDNTTISSMNELHESNSSRSSSVNSDVAFNVSSNDEIINDNDDFGVRIDVD